MKTPLASLLLATAVLVCGCGTMNVFQSSAEYQRTDYAKDFKNDLDRQIRAELGKEPPQGSMAQTYSATLWENYWAKKIKELRTDFPKSKDYRGPSGAWFADYIISTRRTEGLPDLPGEGK